MMYSLTDLLTKMGAPEVRERGHIAWHYFNKNQNDLAGSAQIRLEEGGTRLVAELTHIKENYEDDRGRTHAQYTESFYLRAERTTSRNQYKITRLSFDGEEYPQPTRAVIELGLSIFHARALDISILMVEQAFNKRDLLDPVSGIPSDFKLSEFKKNFAHLEKPAQKKPTAVIIPFRPRVSRLAANTM